MGRRNPEDLRKELEQIEFEGSARTLALLRAEANPTVERQLEALADVDDEASRMLRLNVLLVGVVVSALSIASRVGSGDGRGPIVAGFRNVSVELGVASLVVSTALAAITYTATEYDVGVSSDNVERLLLAGLSIEKVRTLLLKSYVARINFNRSSNVRNIPLITGTVVFAVVGVVLLSLGTYQATIRPLPWWLSLGGMLLIGAVVLISGIVTQTTRAIEDIFEWR